MACRQLNESTQAWLERLIAIDASETIIEEVTAILQRETAGSISISNRFKDSTNCFMYSLFFDEFNLIII